MAGTVSDFIISLLIWSVFGWKFQSSFLLNDNCRLTETLHKFHKYTEPSSKFNVCGWEGKALRIWFHAIKAINTSDLPCSQKLLLSVVHHNTSKLSAGRMVPPVLHSCLTSVFWGCRFKREILSQSTSYLIETAYGHVNEVKTCVLWVVRLHSQSKWERAFLVCFLAAHRWSNLFPSCPHSSTCLWFASVSCLYLKSRADIPPCDGLNTWGRQTCLWIRRTVFREEGAVKPIWTRADEVRVTLDSIKPRLDSLWYFHHLCCSDQTCGSKLNEALSFVKTNLHMTSFLTRWASLCLAAVCRSEALKTSAFAVMRTPSRIKSLCPRAVFSQRATHRCHWWFGCR